jgi:hypothetical protein
MGGSGRGRDVLLQGKRLASCRQSSRRLSDPLPHVCKIVAQVRGSTDGLLPLGIGAFAVASSRELYAVSSAKNFIRPSGHPRVGFPENFGWTLRGDSLIIETILRRFLRRRGGLPTTKF